MKTIKKHTQVTVKHILGETAEVLVTRLDNGKYQFNCDAYVAGESCQGGFFHLRQVREVIPGKKLGNNVKFWPRLRKALHVAGAKRINIPGGDYPIHYEDEIVVPDYKVYGSHYFVIKRSDIGKYLEQLPLDEAGQAHAEEIAKREAEAAAETYRQAHDPKCIAERIGKKLYSPTAIGFEREFIKITLIADDESEYSVIYAGCKTDLLWRGDNVAQVVCTAPETGIEYLSGSSAGHLDPRKHSRIKKTTNPFGDEVAYLMPDPNLATEKREHYRWLDMFDQDDNDGVSPIEIARANRVILETYDLNDKLFPERYVYHKDSEKVEKEVLHDGKWSTEKI